VSLTSLGVPLDLPRPTLHSPASCVAAELGLFEAEKAAHLSRPAKPPETFSFRGQIVNADASRPLGDARRIVLPRLRRRRDRLARRVSLDRPPKALPQFGDTITLTRDEKDDAGLVVMSVGKATVAFRCCAFGSTL
jgi:hypothetical protein